VLLVSLLFPLLLLYNKISCIKIITQRALRVVQTGSSAAAAAQSKPTTPWTTETITLFRRFYNRFKMASIASHHFTATSKPSPFPIPITKYQSRCFPSRCVLAFRSVIDAAWKLSSVDCCCCWKLMVAKNYLRRYEQRIRNAVNSREQWTRRRRSKDKRAASMYNK
jgi:hypothetical protein